MSATDFATENARRNEAFRADVERWDFRFRCEDCNHYAPVADRCAVGFESSWLTTPEVRMVTPVGHVVFCKHFEAL